MISAYDQSKAVFLNIPYDTAFERLYVAYIVGLNSLGFTPHTALEIPDSTRRLERIQSLLRTCRYSIHDLSRAQASRLPPRFNMPFELGLAVGWAEQHAEKNSWLVCDSEQGRLLKCISDLNGTDVYIHDGRVDGVMRSLCNMFVNESIRPDVRLMMKSYRRIRAALPEIKRRTGANSLFETRIFLEMGSLQTKAAATTSRYPAPTPRTSSYPSHPKQYPHNCLPFPHAPLPFRFLHSPSCKHDALQSSCKLPLGTSVHAA